MEISTIVKRNGKVEPFTALKIQNAIKKALVASQEKLDNDPGFISSKLGDRVISLLKMHIIQQRMSDGEISGDEQLATVEVMPDVESVQDIVESVLWESGYKKTMREFSEYRRMHKRAREYIQELFARQNVTTKFGVNQVIVLAARYLSKNSGGKAIELPEEAMQRVANYVAKAELNYPGGQQNYEKYVRQFAEMMNDCKFLPNTPTLINAGRATNGTLSACFVVPIDASVGSIFHAIFNCAVIFKEGGGVGFNLTKIAKKNRGSVVKGSDIFNRTVKDDTRDIFGALTETGQFLYDRKGDVVVNFGTLRPSGDTVQSTQGVASGPVSFMRIFDAASEMLNESTHAGCVICTLPASHPDVETLIKESPQFKSVVPVIVYGDDFVKAKDNNQSWNLVNPRTGEVLRSVSAAELYDDIQAGVARSGKLRVVNSSVDGCWRKLAGECCKHHGEKLDVYSPSVLGVMRLVDAVINEIKQGGARRGAGMCMCSVTHPEIYPFIRSKSSPFEPFSNINISVAMTRAFFEAYKADAAWLLKDPETGEVVANESAKDIWKEIVYNAHACGDPGIVFLDKINDRNPTPNLGEIESTNPCLTGNTLIAVADGRDAVPIEQLAKEGKDIPVYCYDLDKKSIKISMGRNPRKTGSNVDIVRVNFDDGSHVDCTPNHKFLLRDGNYIEATQLKSGDSLRAFHKWEYHGYKQVHLGNGKIRGEHKLVVEYVENAKLTNEWRKQQSIATKTAMQNPEVRKHFNDAITRRAIKKLADCQSKTDLPCYLVGNVVIVKKTCEYCHKDFEIVFGKREQSFCNLKCSEAAKKYWNTPEGRESRRISAISSNKARAMKVAKFFMEKQVDFTQENWDDKKEIARDLGIRIWLSKSKIEQYFSSWNEFVQCAKAYNHKVVSVELIGKGDVFNLTTDTYHNFAIVSNNSTEIFDQCGIISSNCGEQPLLPNEACCLGSINLAKFFKKPLDGRTEGWGAHVDFAEFERVTRLGVRFLDDVIDANHYPVKEIYDAVARTRKIGLGVMGFADLLYLLEASYESDISLDIVDLLMDFMRKVAIDESCKLGKERGIFPAWNGSIYDPDSPHFKGQALRLRNATVLTIAPTGSLSMIADCSPGIEPNFLLAYSKRVLDGRELVYENVPFKNLLYDYGIYSNELIRDVIENGGTLDGLDGAVPPHIHEVFVTAHDISPECHLKVQNRFQKYVCNSISKTVNLPHEATRADVDHIFELAATLDVKGVTVFRDNCKTAQVYVPIKIGKKLQKCNNPEKPDCPGILKFDGRCFSCDTCGASRACQS